MDAPQIIFTSEKKKPMKIDNCDYFSANDFSLTENELEKARIELFETEEKKVTMLQELRDRLSNDTGVNYRTDYLLRILRVRKYNSTKAYQNIKEGYLFRRKHHDFSHTPENLEQLLNRSMFRYLPYTDEEGRLLFQVHFENWKCEEITVNDFITVATTIMDIIAMNPRMQVNGVIAIWDVSGLTAQHVASVLRKFGLRELTFFVENVFPMRVKKILSINTGFLSRQAYKMIRPFLSKKVSERFIVLGHDIKELHEYVNPVLLPKELGGFLDENQCSVTQNIMDNIPYLKYERSFL